MNAFETYIETLSLPAGWILPVIFLAALLLGIIAWQLRSLLMSRLLAVLAFSLLFMTPYVTQATLAPVDPVALVIVDQSASMQLGDRPRQTREMTNWLQQQLQDKLQLDRYDVAIGAETNTQIFNELMPLIQKYDPARIAAVFLITDGQIADTPPKTWPHDGPPLHVLLAGKTGEQQAYLEIQPPPPYAVTNTHVQIRIRAHWPAVHSRHTHTILSISSSEKKWQQKIPLNEWAEIQLPVSHRGNNRFILALPKFAEAVFPAAQTAVVDLHGIEGGMKILWQSAAAEPPSWLNTARADPMIQFSIASMDNTEFENYDAVILDQPLSHPHLPAWEQPLLKYLRNGSSVLLFQTTPPADELSPRLAEILPVTWHGTTTGESPVVVTTAGTNHPITADMVNLLVEQESASAANTNTYSHANFLLTTNKDNVLLAISDVHDGRIASITGSNLIESTAGTELFRRILLWLSHDPDLSSQAISTRYTNGSIEIEYLNNDPAIRALQITRPDQTLFELPVTVQDSGLNTAAFTPNQTGVYMISDGAHESAFIHGNVMTPEFQSATATATKLNAIAQKTGGRIIWIDQTPQPEFQWVTARQNSNGNWLALRETRAFVSTDAVTYPLLPKLFSLLLLGGALSYAWWRETR